MAGPIRSVRPRRLQWGHRLSAMETSVLVAVVVIPERLQWGHRLSAMETAEMLMENVAASGLQWGHRLSAMETFLCQSANRQLHTPSMGPPPFSDGNLSASNPPFPATPPLQWGHRLSAMETLLTPCAATMGLSPFNGATAFQRWKRGHRRARGRRRSLPSMGPPPFSDGN